MVGFRGLGRHFQQWDKDKPATGLASIAHHSKAIEVLIEGNLFYLNNSGFSGQLTGLIDL